MLIGTLYVCCAKTIYFSLASNNLVKLLVLFLRRHFFWGTKYAVGILLRRSFSRGYFTTHHLFHDANLAFYFVDNLVNGIHNQIGLFHCADAPNRSKILNVVHLGGFVKSNFLFGGP